MVPDSHNNLLNLIAFNWSIKRRKLEYFDCSLRLQINALELFWTESVAAYKLKVIEFIFPFETLILYILFNFYLIVNYLQSWKKNI